MPTETKKGFFADLPSKPLLLNFIIWMQILGFIAGAEKVIPALINNFDFYKLIALIISICLVLSAFGLIKLAKWGLYSFAGLTVISFIFSVFTFYNALYITSSPFASNFLFLLTLAGGLVWLIVILIYLFCIRNWFDPEKRAEIEKSKGERKPVKTALIVLGVIAAIFVAIIIFSAVFFFYLKANPDKAQKFGQGLFGQEFTLLCKNQPKEKQNRCFALAAGTMEDRSLCNAAPDKNECLSAIGKVDPKEFDSKK